MDSAIKVESTMDMQLRQLEKVAVQLYNDKIFGPAFIKSDQFNAMQAKKALYNYDITNDFIHELFFYIRDDELLYSSLSSYSISSFIGSAYHYAHWDKASFRNDINSICQPVWRPSESVTTSNNTPQNFITYLYPLPPKSTEPYATVIILIKAETVQNLINDTFSEANGNTIVLDKSNNVILANKNSNYLSSEEFKSSIATLDGKETRKVSLDGIQYLYAYVQSDVTGWKYVNIIPLADATKKINDMKLIVSLVTVFILMFGGILIYFFMYINYNPIKQLKEFTEASWRKVPYVRDELEIARLAIANLLDSTNLLEAKVNSNRTAIKEFLLLELIKGEVKEVSEFNNIGRDIGIIFTKTYYRAVIFLFNNTEPLNGVRGDTLFSDIEKFLSDQVECYVKNCFDKERLVLLLCTDNMTNGELESQLFLLQSYLFDHYSLKVTIGVGNGYCEISQVGKSYMEASTAIDHRLVYGNGKVLFFSNTMSKSSTFDYFPRTLLETLELSIRLRDTDKITDSITKIINIIKENNTPLVIARCISFDIINTTIKALGELNRYSYVPGKYPDVLSLMEFQTVEELAELVTMVYTEICDSVQASREENSAGRMVARIHEYIENNYWHNDFSIQMMADHFKISPSNLSHFYKKQVGKNIIDYVNFLRIKKAKELLLQSGYSINKIVTDVGYYDTSTFIKKFKQMVGTTPGEYRRLHSQIS